MLPFLNNDGSSFNPTLKTVAATVSSFEKLDSGLYNVFFEGAKKSFVFEADEVNPTLKKAIGAPEEFEMVSDLYIFFNNKS